MIELRVAESIARITLNAPQKMNSLNVAALEELSVAYDKAATGVADGSVRALVLTGAGRGFCAGRDISAVNPADDDVIGYLGGAVQPLLEKMSNFPAPTFALVQGACLGVGLGLAIATDVVYVADNAKIGSPFANLGATLDSGGHWLFTERLGAHRTLDMIYTAELISGAEAVRSGLFSRSFPAEELVERGEEMISKVALGATQAFVESKHLVQEIRDHRVGLWASMNNENRAQAALCDTPDYAEGFKSFQEKRPPVFFGRK